MTNLEKIKTKILNLLEKNLNKNEKTYLNFLKQKLISSYGTEEIRLILKKEELSFSQKNFFNSLLEEKTKAKVKRELTIANLDKKEKKLKANINLLKHFPSSVREWNNSIYLYNKNNLNLIPSAAFNAMKIIKGFFSLYNKNLESEVRTERFLLRFRRLSTNKVYLSKSEFKHNNNNVLINIYVFNRQKYNYLSLLKKAYLEKFFNEESFKGNITEYLKQTYLESLNSIKEINKNKYSLVKGLNLQNKYKINMFKHLSSDTLLFYKEILNLTMEKLYLYFYYKQLIFINRSKFNYTYLRLLKKHLENLYNKNVEFNLINLRRFYLNSDILSETIKLKITANKDQMINNLKTVRDKVKIQKRKYFSSFATNKSEQINNLKVLRIFVFNKLKYKHVRGFRLEANGRLSKRFTASRSVHKLFYKGNLHNIDANFRGISSVILKGNLRSNLQYTKVKSKARIGSFGIKGWVSGD